MNYVGVDIGSTCAKTAVLNESHDILETFVIATGWSSREALDRIKKELKEKNIILEEVKCVATGYGREAVDFADKRITEITCHANGTKEIFQQEEFHLIDIGGQDTKVICCEAGKVQEFYMNDKCSAGTGKFLEIMANRMSISIDELGSYACRHTEKLGISSMCTVFAESEIVALIGKGTSKENISWGVLDSVVRKVGQEYSKLTKSDCPVYLTGGLCENEYFIEMLSERIGKKIISSPLGRYAGAIGAAKFAASLI